MSKEGDHLVEYLSDLGPALRVIPEGSEHPDKILIEDLLVERMCVIDFRVRGKGIHEFLDDLNSHVEKCEDCKTIKDDYVTERMRGHLY